MVKFDLRAAGTETKGRARSAGGVQLQQNHRGKERAVVKARLNDICPPDGYGAYLQLRVYYPSDADSAYSSASAEDTRGCSADSQDVLLRTGWVADPYRVSIRLYEYDADSGDIANRDAETVFYEPTQLDRLAP